MANLVNVVTLKWGTRYGSEFVNNRHSAVARHLRRPHRFVCFTDDWTGLGAGYENDHFHTDLVLATGHDVYRKFDFTSFPMPLVDTRNAVSTPRRPRKYFKA